MINKPETRPWTAVKILREDWSRYLSSVAENARALWRLGQPHGDLHLPEQLADSREWNCHPLGKSQHSRNENEKFDWLFPSTTLRI